jgi:glycosyltransferase involved in cell wall biosynthesis
MRRVLLAFEPPDGGVAENVAQLADGLGRWGWEVELAGPRQSAILDRASAAGIVVHRVDWTRGYGSPLQNARSALQLQRCLTRGAFDLVHCHSAKAGVIGRVVARSFGLPTVYSPHCFPFVGEFGAPRRLFATTIERVLARVTERIICVSQDEWRQARRISIAEHRLSIIRNGCATCPETITAHRPTERFAEGGLLAASIAVLREQKGIQFFIDAAPLILARVPQARVAVIGDGPLRAELLARAARLGLDREPRFTFLPFGGSSSVHLVSTDVFVLPSLWESLAIGLLEALACGVPTVATDVGGTGEVVVPDTGVLIPPGDPEALADAVVQLFEDPGRREAMSLAARKRHATHFTLERMVEETVQVYESVLSGPGSTPPRQSDRP